MGIVAAVPFIVKTIIDSKKKHLDIPQSTINQTRNATSQLNNLAASGISHTNALLAQLKKGNKWIDVKLSYQIVKSADQTLDELHKIRRQYNVVKTDCNAIIQNCKKPDVWEWILAGLAGPVGLAVLALDNEIMKGFNNSMIDFGTKLDAMNTALFIVSKWVKEAEADGKIAVSESQQNTWNRFLPQMTDDANQMIGALNQVLQNIHSVNDKLNELEGKHAEAMKTNAAIWNGRVNMVLLQTPIAASIPNSVEYDEKKVEQSGVIVVNVSSLPNYNAATKLSSSDDEKSDKKQPVAPLMLFAKEEKAPDKKKILDKTRAKLVEKATNKLKTEKDTMANDPTQYHALALGVQKVKPTLSSKPDSKSDDKTTDQDVWGQYAKIADQIGEWAAKFTNAVIDAPLSKDTKLEIFNVVSQYKSLLQSTSLRLQDYRLFVKKIQSNLDQILQIIVPPKDVITEWKKMKKDDPKLKEAVQNAAKENKTVLQDKLKTLSALLHDNTELNSLLKLKDGWGSGKDGMQKQIAKVQADVHDDIEEYKKQMKIMGYVTGAFTFLLCIVAVGSTFGAAAPAVAAETAAEVGIELGGIEAAEVAEVAAEEAAEEEAEEAAVFLGEGAAGEAGEAVESSSLLQTIVKGVKILGAFSVCMGAGKGAQAAFQLFIDSKVESVSAINDGLTKLSTEAELIEMALFFMYKHWSGLALDPNLGADDPYKKVEEGWGKIDVDGLMTSLTDSNKEIQNVIDSIKEAENHVDKSIKDYTKDIYEPMEKMWSN
eukprot:295938_1